jgi:tetratricopeptide (TPR) repeat protein
VTIAQEAVKQNPTAENYVNLSLAFYNSNQFLESAVAAKAAAQLKPGYGIAWNNICAAYNRIGEWDSAFDAGAHAVQLQPDDQLSKNNFIYAQQQKAKFDGLEAAAKQKNDYVTWINLGIEWDKVGNYQKSLLAAEKAAKIKPDDAAAWNNVCVAANKLHDWDKAIAAGEKAVQLKPDFDLAKNNLAEARKGKSGQ